MINSDGGESHWRCLGWCTSIGVVTFFSLYLWLKCSQFNSEHWYVNVHLPRLFLSGGGRTPTTWTSRTGTETVRGRTTVPEGTYYTSRATKGFCWSRILWVVPGLEPAGNRSVCASQRRPGPTQNFDPYLLSRLVSQATTTRTGGTVHRRGPRLPGGGVTCEQTGLRRQTVVVEVRSRTLSGQHDSTFFFFSFYSYSPQLCIPKRKK